MTAFVGARPWAAMEYRRKQGLCDIPEGRTNEAVGAGLAAMSAALDPAETRAPNAAKSRRESKVQLNMKVSDGDSIAIRTRHARRRGSSRRISDETTTDGRQKLASLAPRRAAAPVE